MIWVLFIIAVIITVLGFVTYDKSYDFENVGVLMSVSGVVVGIVLIVFAIALTVDCFNTAKIDEKIELYETENAKIEEQMTLIVQAYQEHEQKVFGEVTEKNVMSYVTLYPELRSDSLVEKQMSVYYANYETITKLKEDRIMAPTYRWWCYFGK